MKFFKLTPEKMDKTSYLVPPFPLMRYKWKEIAELGTFAQIMLVITTLTMIAVFAVSFYISVHVFIGEPKFSLTYPGPYGAFSGLLSAFIVIKLTQALALLMQAMRIKS